MSDTTIDTVLIPRWILPIAPAGLLEGHALALAGGRIAALLPAAEARQLGARTVIELPEQLLMPGLVNAHSHAPMTLLRGFADDLPLEQWLSEQIWPTEAAWVSEEFVHDGTRLAIAEMILSGTTCFADMYFFPEVIAQAAAEAGMRARLHFPVFDAPTAWGTGADDYIHKGVALYDHYKHSTLISVGFGPHAPYTVSDAALQRVATLVAELDAPVQIHLHETQQEVDDSLRQYGERPLARLARLGLVGPRTQCVHATALNDDDIACLVRANAHVIHCPESNLKLASGFCPVQKLRDAGLNIGLGTDGAASNNDLDLFGELRTAALLAKAVAGDAAALPAEAALRMATLDSARALGLDAEIGSLEPGKWADVIALDLSALPQLPLYHPAAQLVYGNGSACVSHVWVAGRQLLDNRRLTTLNSHDIAARARSWQEKIQRGPAAAERAAS